MSKLHEGFQERVHESTAETAQFLRAITKRHVQHSQASPGIALEPKKGLDADDEEMEEYSDDDEIPPLVSDDIDPKAVPEYDSLEAVLEALKGLEWKVGVDTCN